MPKNSLKIDRFEGGINEFADSRDIEDNQAQILTNINTDSIGKIKLSGGAVPFIQEVAKIEVQEDGWGLFSFRSDYDMINEEGLKGGTYLHGSDTIGRNVNSELGSETSVDIIAKLFDPVNTDSGSKAGIALRESQSEQWTALTNVLPLYEDEDFRKAPIHSNFLSKNGALRIWDSNFKQFGMTNKWFGVVKGTKFIGKDNVNYSSTLTPDWNKESAWLYTHAECKAPTSIQAELFNRIQDTNWQDNTIKSTIAEDLDNSETGIDVSDSTKFIAGDVILVNNELMFIRSVDGPPVDTLTVTRGIYGSVATTHTNGDEVYVVWRNSTHNEVYSPFNYSYYPSLNNQNLSHKDYNCQVIALDFTESDDADEMYENTTPMLTASNFTDTTHDSDATYGWGRATDGINNWSQEFDGIQFMYEFVEQTDLDELAWNKGYNYRFYATLVYDGDPDVDGQESGLTDITPLNSNILNKQAQLYCNLSFKWTGMNNDAKQRRTTSHLVNDEDTTAATERNKELYINPRVTGCRIYYSSSEDNNSNKYLLLTAFFDENGGIKREAGNYMPWCPVNYGNASNVLKSYYRVSAKSDDTEVNINNSHRIDLSSARNSGNAWLFDTPPGGQDYDSINGHNGELTDVLYKCSTEVNGIRHVGNICYPINWDSTLQDVQDATFEQLTRGKKYGDRMLISAPGQPDVLNPQNFIDVVVNDGEEIIHLESLGSYLLQFKQNTLYILSVTVSQNKDIQHQLSGTYKFKGVNYPYHIVKTDKEIFWVNQHGAYIFNGETVIDVSKYKLNENTVKKWGDKDVIVGFDARERIIYIKSTSNISYLYHIDNASWSRIKNGFAISGQYSNFINDNEGRVVSSVFNTSSDGSTVNGLYFIKDEQENGSKHFIQTVDPTPESQSGETFSFVNNGAFEAGKIINIINTGITKEHVGANNLNFTKFTFYEGFLTNTDITLVINPTSGTAVAHLDVGDIIKINNNNSYFTYNETDYEIRGFHGYWEVMDVRPAALPPQDEVDEDPTRDPDHQAQTGVNYPNSFRFRKRTDVGAGEHKDGITIIEKDDDAEIDVFNELKNDIKNTVSTEDDDTTTFSFKDSSGATSSINWNTLFEIDRLNVPNFTALNNNNYFDGSYRITSIISNTKIEISKTFGDGQYETTQGGVIPKFSRLYYDSVSSDPFAHTPKSDIVNENNYTKTPESNLQVWTRIPQPSGNFFVLSKDLDFGEVSREKRIYKINISYSCPIAIPNARVFALVTTKDGIDLLFPNNDKCKNYGIYVNSDLDGYQIDSLLNPGEIETIFPSNLLGVNLGNSGLSSISSATAEIEFNDPKNSLKSALSIQVGICASGVNLQTWDASTGSFIDDPSSDLTQAQQAILEVPGSFVINDINIIYRGKDVR